MRIVVYSPADDGAQWCAALAAHFPDADIGQFDPAGPARQADYAVVWAPPAALFRVVEPFRAIFTMGAGVDRLLRTPDLASLIRGAPVIRLNDAGMSAQMSEYVCHALVRHTRKLSVYQHQQASASWKKWPGIQRDDWPVGVMGIGAIGAAVARTVAALGYPVLGWSRSAKAVPGVATSHGAASLDAFLRSTRVLVCLLPLTPETDGILNRANLSKLQPDGYVINVARGQHLVDADLLDLIEEGHLAGATLDVFREEPLAPDHPFWCHPKITVTPHISALTLIDESAAQIADKIRHIEGGEPAGGIEGLVQSDRGY
jgi:glyoxylate/hydroxypyruvate reductase A